MASTAETDNNLSKSFIELPEATRKRYTRLLENKDIADIYFILGKDKKYRIPANKYILSVKSDVFKTMFFGSLQFNSNEIEIPDIETIAFLTLLNFLYFNEIEINCTKTAFNILYAANIYHVPALENRCEEFLKKNVTIDNAFYLLCQGRFYDKTELIAECLDVIDKNTTETLKTHSFIDIDVGTLICVLKRDTLQIFESKLFQAMVLWAKAECDRKKLNVTPENQRIVLNSAINLIRYDLMPLKEFIIGPIQSELLDYSVVKNFSFDLLSYKYLTEKPRCTNGYREIHLKFNRQTGDSFYIKSRYIYQNFKVKKPIIIVGCVIVNAARSFNTSVDICRKKKTIKGFLQEPLGPSTETLTFVFDRPIILTKYENFCISGYYGDRPSSSWIPGNDGVIICNGSCSGRNMCDYFECAEFENEAVSEIIFYDYVQ